MFLSMPRLFSVSVVLLNVVEKDYLVSIRLSGWLGGSVGRALARDRKVASSTPGLSATE